MGKIPFKISARAGKLIGRENFSNPEGAIIELVKNSYDADAKKCFVFFDIPTKKQKNSNGKSINIPIKEKSTLYIIDNGEGMTKEIIENHWMKIGTGNKEKEYISDNGRIKTGAKGIGRFALDRLGFETEMWTLSKKAKENNGFFWKMDWTQFNEPDKAISQMEADLEPLTFNLKDKIETLTNNSTLLHAAIQGTSFMNGTIIKITHLKDDWFGEEIRNVFKNLEVLIPPRELNVPFEAYFKHFQSPKEYGRVKTAFFNDYDYKLKAFYDAEKLNIDFQMSRNELNVKLLKKKYPYVYKNSVRRFGLETLEARTFKYSKSIENVLKWKLDDSNKKLLQDVGSFEFIFFYLKQANPKNEEFPYKAIVESERKSILERFGGIKIYRDSFRVRPYGDPTNDWLKLGARVAQTPASAPQRIGQWRVRPELTAGIISISRDANPLLIDKSDRGALQENDAFDTFKKIIIGIIHEFEVDRSKMLLPLFIENRKEKIKNREDEIQKKAEALADKIFEQRKKVKETVQIEMQDSLFIEKNEKEERKAYEEAFKETFEAIDDEIFQEENREIAQVRSLASLGLIVSSFAHELKEIKDDASEIKELKKIYKSIQPEEVKKFESTVQEEVPEEIKKLISKYKDGVDIIELLDGNADKTIHWIDYALTSIKKDKRTRGKFEFSVFFKSLEESWRRIFKNIRIKLNINDETEGVDYNFRAFEMDMSTIFRNLINNSIDSFIRLDQFQKREININVKLENEYIKITFADNGAGLDQVFDDKEEIFLPFTTSKRDRKGKEIGTGLGMYLVKSVINDNNGTIDILNPKEGFSVLISFPIRKK